MSQSKKKKPDNRSAEKGPGSKTIDRASKWSWAGFIIASVVIAIILIIVGVFYYQERVIPFQRTIITVDDITINMDYFLKRARLAGGDAISVLQILVNEQVIKLGAPRYGIEVSPEDINQALRETSNTTSVSEFKAWYRQTLNENRLSDSEYKEIVGISLLRARLQQYLAETMPTVAEQVHLQAILLATLEDAEKTRARWAAGEDFADLAREVSLEPESKEKGGDLGWFPRGILPYGLEYAAFDLSTDNVSEPLPYYGDDPSSNPDATPIYYLLMVSEKADSREVSEDFLPVLRGRALQDWLLAEYDSHQIEARLDSETFAWINWQLAKK